MTSGLDTRERNQQGELGRELAVCKRSRSRSSLVVGAESARNRPMFGRRRRCPTEKTLKRPTFAGVAFLKSGGFLVNQTSVGVNVVLSVHACLLLPPVAPPLTGLAAATLR